MQEYSNAAIKPVPNVAQELYGVILAAGNGSRLGYPNELGGKAMVKVQEKPLLYFALQKLQEAGIKKIALVVNPHNLNAICAYVGNGEDFGVHITFVIQEQPLGIAHALSLCEPVTKKHKVALLLVDNLFEASVKGFAAAFLEQNAEAMVFLTKVENPQAFGVAKLVNGKIVQILEKPQEPPGNWVVLGFYLYNAGVYEIIKKIQPSARGELEITDVNAAYLAKGKLCHAKLAGFWLDIGTPENHLKAEQFLPVVNTAKCFRD